MVTHIYDFEGKSPEHVVIPHVAYQAKSAITGQSYVGVILLDTGARSEITFKRTLKQQIAEKLETQTSVETPFGTTLGDLQDWSAFRD